MKNQHTSGKPWYRCIWFFAVMIVGMSVILLSISSFFCPQATAEDKVHLGLMGQWNNNYGDFKAVKIWEHYAYCVTEQGIVIYDINKQLLDNFIPLEDCINLEIDIDDNGMIYLYVVRSKKGLLILNVDKYQGAHYVAQCEPLGFAEDVAIEGDYAYVVGWLGGGIGYLLVIDISDKSVPEIVGSFYTTSSFYGVVIEGEYAFVAAGGLQVIDISDNSVPKIVGSCDTPGSAEGVAISPNGDYAYVADGWFRGLQVIDISSPNDPNIVGSCDIPGYAEDVAIEGDYAFVAAGDLQVIDISDKSVPKIVGSCDTPGNADGVAIEGDYAFVAAGDLQVIDIRDKSAPKIVGSCFSNGYAEDVAIEGDYAFVAAGDLQVIDISDKSKPVLVGICDTPGSANGVAIEGDYAFVADHYEGLQVIDISDKSKPVLVGSFDTSRYAEDVAIEGDYAFVADPSNGLLKFEINKVPSAKGNLILVAGGGADSKNRLWPATQALANYVFTVFINAGYEVYDIWYQGPIFLPNIFHGSNDQLVVDDSTPTSEKLKLAINPWEAPETEEKFKQWEKDLKANTGPLYIYLIGHGAEDSFQIMPGEIITAEELKECIDKFQNGYEDDDGIYHPGTNRHVVVIIESASSGTFIDDLKGAGVTVITAAGDGPCYSKPDYQTDQGQGPTEYDSFSTAFLDANCSFLDPNHANDEIMPPLAMLLRAHFMQHERSF